MTWHNDPRRNRAFQFGESYKIRWEVIPYMNGTGLDIGCGPMKIHPAAIGIDADTASKGANLCMDVKSLPVFASGSMDYVFSSHCLEDLEDTRAALTEWWRVVKPGGHLVLYLPHRDHYPNIGSGKGNPAHKHDFVPADIEAHMRNIVQPAAVPGFDLVENQVRADEDEYSFLQIYRKLDAGAPAKALESWKERSLHGREFSKVCTVIRWGALGDCLVAASTFPLLKEQGYFVQVITGPRGADVLREDPHIDRLLVVDRTYLQANHLQEFAAYHRARSGKLVNFSESFEGAALVPKARPAFWWPHDARHRYFDIPYLQLAHDVAGVRAEYRQKFYATPAEVRKAADWKAANIPAGHRMVVVAPCGSGINKLWGHVFEFVGRLVMQQPSVHAVVMGDLRDAEFIEHERIHMLETTWPARDAFALSAQADLVIGQETGLMNAVAFEPMPKIVLLSHSSPRNLTDAWPNTLAMHGDVPCWPCHRLHSDWSGCRKDGSTGLPACQMAIRPKTAMDHVQRLLDLPAPLPLDLEEAIIG